jgi:protein arginine kinase activator
MLCQQCFKNKANIIFTQISEDKQEQINLCETCADEMGIKESISNLPQIFTGLVLDILKYKEKKGGLPLKHSESGRCPVCGYSWDNYKRTGLLGCANCYITFKNQVKDVLKDIQGNTKHISQNPKSKRKPNVEQNISFLEKALQDAVAKEDYESAAEFRDKINLIKVTDKEK